MRLLKVDDLSFEEVPSHGPFPNYAILSHMWLKPSEDEVTLQDLEASDAQPARSKAGWQKIDFTVKQARKDGIGLVWIDTCCINKLDPTELTEAINCMFSWYRMAQTCYAYLWDLARTKDEQKPDVTSSRWFSRGWTLQELIAPRELSFFDRDWESLRSRGECAKEIASATRIARSLLEYDHVTQAGVEVTELGQYSIAQRMSWAATRRTSRAEDRAYSLLGLFQVIMPLHYGEGEVNAYRRLQQEIIKSSADQSIFAWQRSLDWNGKRTTHSDGSHTPFLAISPECFRNGDHIVPNLQTNVVSYSISNIGLELETGIFLRNRPFARGESSQDVYGAILNCRSLVDPTQVFVLPLRKQSGNRFTIARPHECVSQCGKELRSLIRQDFADMEKQKITILLSNVSEESLGIRDVLCVKLRLDTCSDPDRLSAHAISMYLDNHYPDTGWYSCHGCWLYQVPQRHPGKSPTHVAAASLRLGFNLQALGEYRYADLLLAFACSPSGAQCLRLFETMAISEVEYEALLERYSDQTPSLTSEYSIIGGPGAVEVAATSPETRLKASILLAPSTAVNLPTNLMVEVEMIKVRGMWGDHFEVNFALRRATQIEHMTTQRKWKKWRKEQEKHMEERRR